NRVRSGLQSREGEVPGRIRGDAAPEPLVGAHDLDRRSRAARSGLVEDTALQSSDLGGICEEEGGDRECENPEGDHGKSKSTTHSSPFLQQKSMRSSRLVAQWRTFAAREGGKKSATGGHGSR